MRTVMVTVCVVWYPAATVRAYHRVRLRYAEVQPHRVARERVVRRIAISLFVREFLPRWFPRGSAAYGSVHRLAAGLSPQSAGVRPTRSGCSLSLSRRLTTLRTRPRVQGVIAVNCGGRAARTFVPQPNGPNTESWLSRPSSRQIRVPRQAGPDIPACGRIRAPHAVSAASARTESNAGPLRACRYSPERQVTRPRNAPAPRALTASGDVHVPRVGSERSDPSQTPTLRLRVNPTSVRPVFSRLGHPAFTHASSSAARPRSREGRGPCSIQRHEHDRRRQRQRDDQPPERALARRVSKLEAATRSNTDARACFRRRMTGRFRRWPDDDADQSVAYDRLRCRGSGLAATHLLFSRFGRVTVS